MKLFRLTSSNYKDAVCEEGCVNPISVNHSPLLILKGQISLKLEEHEIKGDLSQNLKMVCSSNDYDCKSDHVIKVINVRQEEHDKINCDFSTIVDLKEGRNEMQVDVLKDKKSVLPIKLPPVIYLKPEQSRRNYFVLPLIVVPSDKPDPETSEEVKKSFSKLFVALKLVQAVYGELLAGQELSRRSFRIDEESCHVPAVLRLALSAADICQMDAYQVWENVAKTLRKTEELWSDNRKYVAFLTTPWNDSGSNFKTALGGGGLAIFNLSISDPWPATVDNIFEALWNTQPLGSEYPQLIPQLDKFGSIGRTVGDFVSASLGSLAHELGHLFDLAHSEVGLMGKEFHKLIRNVLSPPVTKNDFDLLGISKSSAVLLYHHKWFQDSSRLDSETLEASKSLFETSPSNFKVTSSQPFTTIQLRTRSDSDSFVLKEWTFSSPTFTFLPQKGDIPLTSCPSGEAYLVCQNISGDLLKLPISRNSLITSFTRLASRN